jgi:hypothetical protein
MRIAFALTLILFSACTTTLAPGASDIVLTRKPDDVKQCAPLGSVQSTGAASIPGDDLNELRNQAVGAGADTILLTTPLLASAAGGLAYRCTAPSPDASSAEQTAK